MLPVPRTNTRGRGEYPQASEITMVKELCKLAPINGVNGEIPLCLAKKSNLLALPPKGQCLVGSLTGAAEGCLTVRLTSRTDTKVGLSDLPMLSGKVGTQRIKVTPGITGLSFPSDHSDEKDWHLDVGSSHPGGEEATKEERELGSERRETVWFLSIAGAGNLRGAVPSTKGPGWTNQWRTSCHVNGTAG
ncbi:4354_t:CDS:2 [Entrophospora sp. SA101]|nr:4354_t:CDS:2 [Entrophospora sp. SA101]